MSVIISTALNDLFRDLVQHCYIQKEYHKDWVRENRNDLGWEEEHIELVLQGDSERNAVDEAISILTFFEDGRSCHLTTEDNILLDKHFDRIRSLPDFPKSLEDFIWQLKHGNIPDSGRALGTK